MIFSKYLVTKLLNDLSDGELITANLDKLQVGKTSILEYVNIKKHLMTVMISNVDFFVLLFTKLKRKLCMRNSVTSLREKTENKVFKKKDHRKT